MKKEIDLMLDYLSNLTKDEAELIKDVCKWPNEYRGAFLIAKTIFEENLENDNETDD